MAASDRLLRIHEVSELTGVPVNTLRSWRQSETGPQATRLGGLLVWDRAEVEAWVAERLSAGHSRARG
jgi:predicted DNA-binding transcriptional regulator AlpA